MKRILFNLIYGKSFEGSLQFASCDGSSDKTKSGILHREWKEKRVLIVAEKKKQKADYEREEYQNDVRYQNRTEITLDCGLAKRDQGLFHSRCRSFRGTRRYFFTIGVPGGGFRANKKRVLSDSDHTRPQHFHYTTKNAPCKYVWGKWLKLLPNKQKIFVNFW